MNGLRYVRPGGGFEPLMDYIFEKSELNGNGEIALYKYLKSVCSHTFTDFSANLFYTPLRVGDIAWNFEKFLIGRDGKPYTRYHPRVLQPEDISPDIDVLLARPPPHKVEDPEELPLQQ